MASKLKFRLKTGDRVEVITGKERGKRGKILAVFPDTGKVTVEGVARVKRAVKPNQKNPQGGIVEKEMSVDASNVMPVCPSCGEPSRVGARVDDESKKIRVCRNCSEDMDTV